MNTERLNQIKLPELSRFNEAMVKPGEPLDLILATTRQPIFLFTSAENVPAAQAYKSVLGEKSGYLEIIQVGNPIQEAIDMRIHGIIPLVLHSATDPVLNQKMFDDGPRLGQLLMSHIYAPTPAKESPSLYAVGLTNQGLEIIRGLAVQPDESLAARMTSRRKKILGENLTNDDFRDILRSTAVNKIIAHALGPAGTNIAQAMKQYIEMLGVERKTNLIVHPAGIEPMAYAEQARREVEPGVIPIHMECAVYYDMARMYNERGDKEVVFADHHYMQLDAMQLASVKEIEELAANGVMKIATHPSPRPLVDPWVKSGQAEWIKATSNSAAAQMVIAGEVSACITTASGLKEAKGLISRHLFGSPMMLFTIATALNQQQLQKYR